MNDSTITYSPMFSDKRLLIVEDEDFLADETRQKLRELGATLIGPIRDVGNALALIENETVDAAILDLHLGGDLVLPVVETLERLNLPYLFAIGHGMPVVPVGFTGFVLCEKATEIEYIAKALFGSPKWDV
jgi:DNA-binding NtrC family response regulator